MKILKKLYLICLIILGSLCIFNNYSTKINVESSTHAESMQEYNFSKYLNINSFSSLNTSNITKIDNYTYTIISNNTISLSLNAFVYYFDYSKIDLTDFHVTYSKVNLIPSMNEPTTGSFQTIFNENSTTFYYKTENSIMSIYTSQSMLGSYKKYEVTNQTMNTLGMSYSYNNENDAYELIYISNITYTFNEQDKNLTIFFKDGNKALNFTFVKPIVKFYKESEPIVKFNCIGQNNEGNNYEYSPTWLPSERIFNSVTIKFFRNYTETNPLFFNINLNGFTYYYKIFMKDSMLQFQYVDENNEASKIIDKTFIIYNNTLTEENTFDITFTDIGRYEVEFYDLTYNTNLSQEENFEHQANYYSTSFYIYDDTKTFENIYIVSQSYENGSPIDYIVSNSSSSTAATLNTDVRSTIKNLYFLDLESFKKVTVVVEKYYFSGTGRPEISTYNYQKEEFMQCYENKTDFYVTLTEDARYNIKIYYENTNSPILSTSYHIVKLPKQSFQVDQDSDPFIQEDPFTKTEILYTIPLHSQIKLNISYKNSLNEQVKVSEHDSTFDKIYLNKFSIFYGIPSISIERYTRMYSEGGEAKPASTLDIEIKCVGDVEVTVIVNGTKTIYNFKEKEKKTLTFSEFGEYSIQAVDEMGTIATGHFSYQKSLNMSAIILIILSGIIVLAVVIFIVLSRTKIATR